MCIEGGLTKWRNNQFAIVTARANDLQCLTRIGKKYLYLRIYRCGLRKYIGITLLAKFIEPMMTAAALSNLSLVGSIMIFCVGANLLWNLKIRVANMLPALVIAVAWAFLPL